MPDLFAAGICVAFGASSHLLRYILARFQSRRTPLLLPPPLSATDFLKIHLPNLKSSLIRTLNTFYPLAGAIRPSLRSADRFEMSYYDDDSVSFTVCESACDDFDDLSCLQQRSFEKLKKLAPILAKSYEAQPLLAVQVTLFPNQGLCLGLSIHHSASDGISSIHFLKSWAAAAGAAAGDTAGAGGSPPPPPSLERSAITDPRDLYSKRARIVFLKRSHLSNYQPPPPPPPLITATFTVSSTQIQTIKHRFQQKATNQQKSPIHLSTFVISTACAWTCHVKAKGYDVKRMAHLFFSVNVRSRLQPPPPANYFGNCLGSPCFVKAVVGDIVAEKDGIFMACEVIGKAVQGINGDVYEEMEGVHEKLMEVLPHKPLTIAGSPKLRVYEVDFGWGKPEKVEITSIGMGAISLAESKEDEGGVEIGVVLPEDEINEFAKQYTKFQSECKEKQRTIFSTVA